MCLGMLRPTRSARRVSRGRTKLFSAAPPSFLTPWEKITGGSVYLSAEGSIYLSAIADDEFQQQLGSIHTGIGFIEFGNRGDVSGPVSVFHRLHDPQRNLDILVDQADAAGIEQRVTKPHLAAAQVRGHCVINTPPLNLESLRAWRSVSPMNACSSRL
jgi:hypothetical protein